MLVASYTVHIYRYKFLMKPGTPPLKSARLLDQVKERVRYLHYSLKTEKAYLYWILFFIRWIAAQGAGMRRGRSGRQTDKLSAAVWSGDTICLKSAYNGRSRRPCHWRAFTSQFQSIPCAIHLPLIFCKLAPIFARCKSCWATRMSAPP